MKLRVTVEVEIDEEALNREYAPEGTKSAEMELAYRNEGFMPEETRRMFAMDALDRHHGMPKRCVKSWNIVENTLAKE